MQSRQIVAEVATIVMAAWTASAAGQAAAPPPAKPAAETTSQRSPVSDQPEVARRIVQSTNRFRASKDLPEIRPNAELARAAEYFANFMASTGKYGHTADEKQPWDRAAEHGYVACIVAENIGLESSSKPLSDEALAGVFVEGWKTSQEHRANLLDPDVTQIGVAVAKSEKSGKHYAVQLFARPKSESIQVEIENRAGATLKYKLGGETLELEERVVRIHELYRPTEFTFLLPAADGTERTVVERMAHQTRLVVQRDESKELAVVRSAAEQ